MRSLFDKDGAVLDSEALVLYFAAPKTVTGEDVLELHIHGGPAIVKAVLTAIGACNTASQSIRYAEPGEFTRRAFLNNRIDLTKVEALGDTLSAVTEEQRRLSVQGTVSGLATRYENWRQSLLAARGELEALIDFSEDQHFDESPAELAASVAVQIRALKRLLNLYSSNAVRGELLRNGISLSLIGAPNVGKSSLLNQIVGRNAAIVSQEAGTTRDIVEVGVDLGGFFCRFGDTAGLRDNTAQELKNVMASVIGEVEKEGIKRAKEKAMQSDVVVIVFSIEPNQETQNAEVRLEEEVLDTARQLLEAYKNIIVVINKVDKLNQHMAEEEMIKQIQKAMPAIPRKRIFSLSCQEARSQEVSSNPDPGNFQNFVTGLTAVFREITDPLAPSIDGTSPQMWQDSLGATERQRLLLDECSTHLQDFLDQVNVSAASDQDGVKNIMSNLEGVDFDIVVAAESLRAAADCMAKLTGRGEAGDVEEVLGVVFEKYVMLRLLLPGKLTGPGRFCVGK